jgi:hypothetical protein
MSACILALTLLGTALLAIKSIFIKLALGQGSGTGATLTWRMIVAVPIVLTAGILGRHPAAWAFALHVGARRHRRRVGLRHPDDAQVEPSIYLMQDAGIVVRSCNLGDHRRARGGDRRGRRPPGHGRCQLGQDWTLQLRLSAMILLI